MMLILMLFAAFFTTRVTAIEHLNPISNPYRRADADQVDKSLLAVQVGGIVAAYVGFISIVLALLLFVGRRLRQTVHSSNYSLQVEMMKPINPPPSTDPSPVTPLSAHLPSPKRLSGFNRSWGSLGRTPKSHHDVSNNGSVATIDESVVASDRRRAQDQMEMLYAAVMEHDEQKAAMMTMPKENHHSSSGSGSSSNNNLQSPDSVVTDPFTDRSSRILEEQPEEDPTQTKQLPPTPRSSNSRLSKRISSLSLFSSNSRMSTPGPSKVRSPRLPISKLSISSPMASPDITATTSYGDDQPPLTPRLYNPAPPPPAPPVQVSPAPPPAKSSGMGRAPAPTPLSLSTTSRMAPSSQGAPPGGLPFRDAFPLQSAPPTKTTILERPSKPNGPRTGMPTPYSPYMPFTPVTPLTPSRIVTRQQRKQQGKENGLRVLKEDDMVKDDEDMWGY